MSSSTSGGTIGSPFKNALFLFSSKIVLLMQKIHLFLFSLVMLFFLYSKHTNTSSCSVYSTPALLNTNCASSWLALTPQRVVRACGDCSVRTMSMVFLHLKSSSSLKGICSKQPIILVFFLVLPAGRPPVCLCRSVSISSVTSTTFSSDVSHCASSSAIAVLGVLRETCGEKANQKNLLKRQKGKKWKTVQPWGRKKRNSHWFSFRSIAIENESAILIYLGNKVLSSLFGLFRHFFCFHGMSPITSTVQMTSPVANGAV